MPQNPFIMPYQNVVKVDGDVDGIYLKRIYSTFCDRVRCFSIAKKFRVCYTVYAP